MSQMEWAPFKSLFWNTNELIDLFESIDKFDLQAAFHLETDPDFKICNL